MKGGDSMLDVSLTLTPLVALILAAAVAGPIAAAIYLISALSRRT